MFSMYSFFLAKKLKSLNKQSSKEKKKYCSFSLRRKITHWFTYPYWDIALQYTANFRSVTVFNVLMTNSPGEHYKQWYITLRISRLLWNDWIVLFQRFSYRPQSKTLCGWWDLESLANIFSRLQTAAFSWPWHWTKFSWQACCLFGSSSAIISCGWWELNLSQRY